MRKKLFAIAVTCLLAVPALAGPADSFREIGSRLRGKIAKVLRLVTLGDNLQPPKPQP